MILRVTLLALSALPAAAVQAAERVKPPAVVEAAAQRAVVRPELRAEVSSWLPPLSPDCAVVRAEAAPVRGSGRVPVKTEGIDSQGRLCRSGGWATVRVTASVLVLTRRVGQGESLQGAVRSEPREVKNGHSPVTLLPEDATAARTLEAGRLLEPENVSVGPPPGSTVLVRISQGPLRVEKVARRVPCGSGRFCAAFSNGKRTEGRWDGQALWVEAR